MKTKAKRLNRRSLLRRGGVLGLLAGLFGAAPSLASRAAEMEEGVVGDFVASLFQRHYQHMTPEEVTSALTRIERNAKRDLGVELECKDDKPIPGVVFGYALNISKCKGVRKCVDACIAENNQDRGGQVQYIRVLEMNQGSMDLNESDHYYQHEEVPKAGKYYLPIQCMQCDNPPCVKACPVNATWQEPDGITVVDYDWCIGCRYCMAACPYWARHFNWAKPQIPAEQVNTDTHYLGNRPRPKGVVEKCTYCIQRTRRGQLPACLEACPTGARIFGNLLDPDSDIRYVLENKTVFRLKEELGAEPKFWYYTD